MNTFWRCARCGNYFHYDPGECPECTNRSELFIIVSSCIKCEKSLRSCGKEAAEISYWSRICNSHQSETEREIQAERKVADSLRNIISRSDQKIEVWRNIFVNAQNHLGVNDLNQLPPMPQGQNLQTLINFYNDSRQQINNANNEEVNRIQRKLDDTTQQLSQAEGRLDATRNKLNLNQIQELDGLPQLPQGETISQIWEEVQNFRQRSREERIRRQRERLNQLRTNIRNRLNNNLHTTLDDLLETQTELGREEDNPFAQRLLERFRIRLLDSEQLSEEEINSLCQVQLELSRLEVQERQQNPQFEARQQQR